jgi:hypothetical protein
MRALGVGHNLIDYLLADFTARLGHTSSVASGDMGVPGHMRSHS